MQISITKSVTFKASRIVKQTTESNKKQHTSSPKGESLGFIHVKWQLSKPKDVSHVFLKYHSSTNISPKETTLNNQQNTFDIGLSSSCKSIVSNNDADRVSVSCDNGSVYSIELTIVTTDGTRKSYPSVQIPTPGEPDPPRLWLVRQNVSSFLVEWSEPKTHDIPVSDKTTVSHVDENRFR
jgi:hypothetical protein